MRYIEIFQIMEPRNLLKSYFEISVTYEPFRIFCCGFHCCAQENELYHFFGMCFYLHWCLFKFNSKCVLAFGYFVVKLYESNYQYIFQTCMSCHNHVQFEAIIHTLTSD